MKPSVQELKNAFEAWKKADGDLLAAMSEEEIDAVYANETNYYAHYGLIIRFKNPETMYLAQKARNAIEYWQNVKDQYRMHIDLDKADAYLKEKGCMFTGMSEPAAESDDAENDKDFKLPYEV